MIMNLKNDKLNQYIGCVIIREPDTYFKLEKTGEYYFITLGNTYTYILQESCDIESLQRPKYKNSKPLSLLINISVSSINSVKLINEFDPQMKSFIALVQDPQSNTNIIESYEKMQQGSDIMSKLDEVLNTEINIIKDKEVESFKNYFFGKKTKDVLGVVNPVLEFNRVEHSYYVYISGEGTFVNEGEKLRVNFTYIENSFTRRRKKLRKFHRRK
jgi:hypothetical protein